MYILLPDEDAAVDASLLIITTISIQMQMFVQLFKNEDKMSSDRERL